MDWLTDWLIDLVIDRHTISWGDEVHPATVVTVHADWTEECVSCFIGSTTERYFLLGCSHQNPGVETEHGVEHGHVHTRNSSWVLPPEPWSRHRTWSRSHENSSRPRCCFQTQIDLDARVDLHCVWPYCKLTSLENDPIECLCLPERSRW